MDPSQEPAAKGGIPPKQVLPGPPPGPGTTIYFGSDLGMPPATPDVDALTWCAPQLGGYMSGPITGTSSQRWDPTQTGTPRPTPQAQELPFTLDLT